MLCEFHDQCDRGIDGFELKGMGSYGSVVSGPFGRYGGKQDVYGCSGEMPIGDLVQVAVKKTTTESGEEETSIYNALIGGDWSSGHSNLVAAYIHPWRATGRFGGNFYIMSDTAKYDLQSLIKEEDYKNAVNISVIIEILRQLLTAVAYMHSMNVCHLDLKFGNILVFGEVGNPKFNIRVIDLGSGSKLDDRGVATRALDYSRSGRRLPCSPMWAAPEIGGTYLPERVGRPADCWSTGMVFYRLFLHHMQDIVDRSNAVVLYISTGDYELSEPIDGPESRSAPRRNYTFTYIVDVKRFSVGPAGTYTYRSDSKETCAEFIKKLQENLKIADPSKLPTLFLPDGSIIEAPADQSKHMSVFLEEMSARADPSALVMKLYPVSVPDQCPDKPRVKLVAQNVRGGEEIDTTLTFDKDDWEREEWLLVHNPVVRRTLYLVAPRCFGLTMLEKYGVSNYRLIQDSEGYDIDRMSPQLGGLVRCLHHSTMYGNDHKGTGYASSAREIESLILELAEVSAPFKKELLTTFQTERDDQLQGRLGGVSKLLQKLLGLDPESRITAENALGEIGVLY